MARRPRKMGKVQSSARAKYDESKHVRGAGGRFGNKAGAGDDAPKAAAKAQKGRSLGEKVTGDSAISVAVPKNPKKVGSASHAHFELYSRHKTVREYIAAHPGGKKKALADLKWDMDKGFITLGPAARKRAVGASAPKSAHHDEDIFSDGKKQMSFGQLKKIFGTEQAEAFVKQPQIVKVAAAGSERANEFAAVKKSLAPKFVAESDAHKLTLENTKGAIVHVTSHGKSYRTQFDGEGISGAVSLSILKMGIKKGTHRVQLASGKSLEAPKPGPKALVPSKVTPLPPIAKQETPSSERWDAAPDSGYSLASYRERAISVRESTGLVPTKASDNESVEFYVGEGYSDLNDRLRKMLPLSSYHQDHTRELDSLVSASKFQSDTIMYRGIGTSKSDVLNYNDIPPPSDFVDEGYSSVSFNPKVSADFAGRDTDGSKVVFRVRVPRGTPGAHVDREHHADPIDDEAEVILGRATRYRYVGDGGTHDIGYGRVRIIDLELVPHN